MPPTYEQPRPDRPPEIVTDRVEHYQSTRPGFRYWTREMQLAGIPLNRVAYWGFDGVPYPVLSDVTITVEASGELLNTHVVNALRLYIGEQRILADGIFAETGTNCPCGVCLSGVDGEPNRAIITITAPEWNSIIESGTAGGGIYDVLLNVGEDIYSNIHPDFCDPYPFQCRAFFEFDYGIPDVQPLNLKLWNEDLCHNAAFVPVLPEDFPFFRLETEHAIRAVAQQAGPTVEVCKPHGAELVVDDEGYARGFYCSRPVPQGFDSEQQNHLCDPFIVQRGDIDLRTLQIPRGYGCFIGSYAAPRWTELQYWSHVETCEAQV